MVTPIDAATQEYAYVEAAAGTRRPWLRRWRTTVVLLVLGIGLAGFLVVINSPLLAIHTITVRGTESLAPQSLAQLSGLRGGNFLTADLADARDRLLTIATVKEASVERIWPSGVRITIVERRPWAAWVVGDETFAIDEEGVVLDGIRPPADAWTVRQTSSLPFIQGGTRVDINALGLVKRISEAGPPRGGPALLGFEWSLRTGMTIVTQHGRIIFGDGDGFDFKYQVWQELETEAQQRREPLLAADLRFGTHPSAEIGIGLGRAVRNTAP